MSRGSGVPRPHADLSLTTQHCAAPQASRLSDAWGGVAAVLAAELIAGLATGAVVSLVPPLSHGYYGRFVARGQDRRRG
jgi:hypothetical protein